MFDLGEIKQHLFIVMGYEHYNPLGVIRSLGENDILPIVIVLKGKTHVASSSKYIRKVHRVKDNDEAYKVLIQYYGQEQKKPFIIPCDDNITEYLDRRYDEIKDKFYFSNAGEQGRITYFQNKDITNKVAQKYGLMVPASWIIRNKIIPNGIKYPIITKPLTSYPGWKEDYYICKDEEELENAINVIRAGDILAQHYIRKKAESCMDGVSFNNGNNIFIANYSVSGYVLDDYYSLKNIHNELQNHDLLNKIEQIFKEIKYEGIFSVDFLIGLEDDIEYFLEINYRNSAYSYAATKMGINLPLIWASCIKNGVLPEGCRKRIPKDYISLAEEADFEHRVIRLHKISIREWFQDIKSADCLLLWEKHDIRPAIETWIKKSIKFVLQKMYGKR